MKIKNRILTIGMLAISSLLILIVSIAFLQFKNLIELKNIIDQIDREILLSNIVHETQKERGLSVGYISEPSSANFELLNKQKVNVDESLNKLFEFDDLISSSFFNERVESNKFLKINNIRENILNKKLDTSETFNSYTILITEIIDQMILRNGVNNEKLKQYTYSHYHLMLAKEYLGELRAILNEGFSLQKFDKNIILSIKEKYGLYHYHTDVFLKESSKNVLNLYFLQEYNTNIKETEKLIEKTTVLDFSPKILSSFEWYQISTTTINLIKNVEDLSLEEIHEIVEKDVTLSVYKLFFIIIFTIITGIVLLLLIVSSITEFLKSLDSLLSGIKKITISNNFTYRIPLQSDEELNIVSKGFNDLLSVAENLICEKTYLAYHDSLTGIYNRHKLSEVFTEEVSRKNRFKIDIGLIIFDIDFFKKINDNYGHHIGDNTLRVISTLISSNIREVDSFARWGGEEFVVLVSGSNKDGVFILAEKLRKKVEEHCFQDIPNGVTASFGISFFENNETLESLVSKADAALYQAKKDGRNCVR